MTTKEVEPLFIEMSPSDVKEMLIDSHFVMIETAKPIFTCLRILLDLNTKNNKLNEFPEEMKSERNEIPIGENVSDHNQFPLQNQRSVQ
jgi:hypothetical protein